MSHDASEGQVRPGVPGLPLLAAVTRPWGVYIHVPFCASRCGYCDFNTYVLAAMGTDAVGAYLEAAHRELDLAAGRLGPGTPEVATVFFGGGTPTMLTPDQIGGLVGHVESLWGLDDDAEVTTEANPETLDAQVLSGLLEAGITRLSMGMQSADAGVLGLLERRHTPGRAVEMARLARQVGFDDISLDLIFGTPGETLESWRASLEDALAGNPDHVSAYSLIVEEGTRFAARVHRGELPMTDEDDLADKYLLTEEVLGGAGFVNYEISNWARPRAGRDHHCRHNEGYWQGRAWWGIGPGAHSHLGDLRWWNLRHPHRYSQTLASGELPVEGWERLGPEEAHEEEVMLGLRTDHGVALDRFGPAETAVADRFVAEGLAARRDGRLVVTPAGRLLADRLVTELLTAT